MSQKFPNSRKSHIGDYSTTEFDTEGFYSTLEYLGYEECPEAKNLPDSLPLVKFIFSNSNNYDVVIEFPFNWAKAFVAEPAFFNFRNIISENYRMEYFSPDKVDTVNDFIRSPVNIVLPAGEQLTFNAFIYHSNLYTIGDKVQEFEGNKDGLWKFGVAFTYFYKDDDSLKSGHYMTKPISIMLRNSGHLSN